MSKKDKVTIARTDDFAEVEAELSSAMEMLDGANARIESLLQEQKKPETEGIELLPSEGVAEAPEVETKA